MTAVLSGSPAAVEAGAATENAIVRKVAWRLMPLIMICYMFAFFDRSEWSLTVDRELRVCSERWRIDADKGMISENIYTV